MKAFVAAAGPFALPVAEELVRACWGIETLFYDARSGADREAFEKFAKQVSFPVRPVPGGDWEKFWQSLAAPSEVLLFLIGAVEPETPLRFSSVYSLQAGLLPGQAGPDPLPWALWKGEPATGLTLYRRGARPYSGDLLFQTSCPIADSDDVGALEEKLKELAIRLVREFWESSTKAQLRPKESFAAAVVNPPWTGGAIPWANPTRDVHNFVRASARPGAGAFTYLKGRKLTVRKTTPLAPRGEIVSCRPGEIFSYDPFRVCTGDGMLRLERVRWEGEEEMDGTAFARTRAIEPGLMMGQDLEAAAPAVPSGNNA
ncbi:MAG TPA: hypothetical protein P5079_09350 [Elusimicrobiota bacterium]|nr:hypothetical protein [Elusimicrobiota bacterium]